MAATTFHRFGELAHELQIHIWSYAATPHGPLRSSPAILPSIFHYRYHRFLDSGRYYPSDRIQIRWLQLMMKPRVRPLYGNKKLGSIVTASARTSLLVTCRLSRQVVLEEWLNYLPSLPLGQGNYHRERCERIRQELLAFVGEMLR